MSFTGMALERDDRDARTLPLARSSSPHSPVGRWDYVPPPVRQLPGPLLFIRRRLFSIFIAGTFLGTCVYLLIEYYRLDPEHTGWAAWLDQLKKASIPLVSVCFTWWHVWLGIQMCFYPIEFHGIPPCLGWQGIVPRRASIMASRACDIMIGNLVTIEEIIERIEPEDFFQKLEPVLGETCACVLAELAKRHAPKVWNSLPDTVKKEMSLRVYEESQNMFRPVLSDIKANASKIFDIKQMAIDALVKDRALLVEMFQKIGRREFTFVLHVAAVMGAVLGVIQLILFQYMQQMTGGGFPWILPVSGLFIGYFTNWLAITMIFRPVNPHIICGGYINIQGVFLKRQVQVASEMSAMICTQLIYARKMLEFIVKTDGFTDVLAIYQKHMASCIDSVVGSFGSKLVLPVFVGHGAIEGIKDEVLQVTIQELPKHSEAIEKYMDKTFAINEIIAPRLAGLPPAEFEGMLRPVFQEDEWMVLLLGGVLGVLVGTMQALVLGK